METMDAHGLLFIWSVGPCQRARGDFGHDFECTIG